MAAHEDDPNNSGMCIKCGWIWDVDLGEPVDVALVAAHNAAIERPCTDEAE